MRGGKRGARQNVTSGNNLHSIKKRDKKEQNKHFFLTTFKKRLKYVHYKKLAWCNVLVADFRILFRNPCKHIFSISKVTGTLLNCFVLKILCSKTKQLRSGMVLNCKKGIFGICIYKT